MLPKRLTKVRISFESEIKNQVNFVQEIQYYRKEKSGKYTKLRKIETEILCEMSFLKLFIAWELFLESSFEEYLLAGPNVCRGIKTYVTVNTLSEARNLIIGDKDNFANWSSPEPIKKRAERFFRNGKPYSQPIADASRFLHYMKDIRNFIAHRSNFSKQKFDKRIREIYGYNPKLSPGRFLLVTPPVTFTGAGSSGFTGSTFEFFVDILKTVAHQIVK